ncbi:proline-rich protein 2-like [Tachyglossus aculeatus]|uniref:proline-rich protein 2-like n=1 Tax=Tachyglossus aculeatus TaxID=9261 RepID=UPI0018F2AE0E|nr:proline-rich protein 2-like [Tachyglossus aculeatus]
MRVSLWSHVSPTGLTGQRVPVAPPPLAAAKDQPLHRRPRQSPANGPPRMRPPRQAPPPPHGNRAPRPPQPISARRSPPAANRGHAPPRKTSSAPSQPISDRERGRPRPSPPGSASAPWKPSAAPPSANQRPEVHARSQSKSRARGRPRPPMETEHRPFLSQSASGGPHPQPIAVPSTRQAPPPHGNRALSFPQPISFQRSTPAANCSPAHAAGPAPHGNRAPPLFQPISDRRSPPAANHSPEHEAGPAPHGNRAPRLLSQSATVSPFPPPITAPSTRPAPPPMETESRPFSANQRSEAPGRRQSQLCERGRPRPRGVEALWGAL